MPHTTYYASTTNRRADGVPIDNADDAEYLSREEDTITVFAVTSEVRV